MCSLCYLVPFYHLPKIEYYGFSLLIFLFHLKKVLSSHSYCLAFSEAGNDPHAPEGVTLDYVPL